MNLRKLILSCIFSLAVISVHSQIDFGTNFRILTNLPIDTRMVAADTIARDSINPMYRYEGLTVYVRSVATNFQLRGGITNSNWVVLNGNNTAYSWGNHALAGYLTASSTNSLTNKSGNISMWTNDAGYLTSFSETDPIWSSASSNYYTKTNMQTSGASQLHFNNITNKPTTLAGYGITDAMSTSYAANSITLTNITNWDTAYSWGNHALAGYITASSTNTLTNKSGNISMWTNDAGYLTSSNENDPVWTTASSNYYTKANMQTSGASQLHFNNITNKPTTLAGYGITDAMSTSYAANSITLTNITNWDTAYSWGNHALAGYLTSSSTDTLTNKSGNISMWTNDAGYLTSFSEIDPVWTVASSNYYTKTNMQTSGASQLHFNNITNKPTTLTGYGITDAMSTSHAANAITGTNISNWNTAYGWGNHAAAGYITASSTNTLTNKSGNISMWTNDAGYLTSSNENDPVWTAASSNYYTKTNMQTSGASQLHFNNITNKPTTLTGYGITDAMSTSHAANVITGTNISNWNTAYSWGNHAAAGYLTASSTNTLTNKSGKISMWTNDAGYLTSLSETDPVWTAASSNYYTKANMQTSGASQLHFNNITNKPTTLAGYGITNAMSTSHAANAITGTNITNWNTAYGWGNHAAAGYLTASSTNTLTNKSGNISMWTNDAGYFKNSSDLYWDNTNKRLGIGTSSPSATLSVGNSNQFQVNSAGNIIKINNITTNFPATQGAANSILTNDGSGNLSWSLTLPGGTKTKTTPEGGFAVYMYNGSGSAISKYMVIMADPYHDNSIAIAPANSILPIGITYDSIANGSWGWIIVSGIATVNIYNSVTRSYYAYVSSSAAGKVEDDNTKGNNHNYRIVGNFLESKTVSCGSQTPATAKIMVHFN